jgi:hypothetical protein
VPLIRDHVGRKDNRKRGYKEFEDGVAQKGKVVSCNKVGTVTRMKSTEETRGRRRSQKAS